MLDRARAPRATSEAVEGRSTLGTRRSSPHHRRTMVKDGLRYGGIRNSLRDVGRGNELDLNTIGVELPGWRTERCRRAFQVAVNVTRCHEGDSVGLRDIVTVCHAASSMAASRLWAPQMFSVLLCLDPRELGLKAIASYGSPRYGHSSRSRSCLYYSWPSETSPPHQTSSR